MKRITVFVLVVINMIILIHFAAGCLFLPGGEVVPKKEESENTNDQEPDSPPPDPPPPPSTLAGNSYLGESTEIESLEDIILSVLNGNYGPTLRKILSDEISTCLNQMASEEAIIINQVEENSVIRINEDKESGIMFNSGYIADEIISGKYGSDAKDALDMIMQMRVKE